MNMMTAAQTRAEIKRINEARGKLVDRIQAAAVAAMYHSHVHREVSLAVELCKAVGAGMKHEALRVWFNKFGPCTLDKEGILKFAKSKALEGDALDERMKAAAAEEWHVAPTERKAEEFSLAAGVHALLRKLNKAMEEDGFIPSDEERELIRVMQRVPAPVKKPKVKEAQE